MLTINRVAIQLEQIQQWVGENLKKGRSSYLIPDPDFGWVIQPNSQHHSLPYQANEFGFRCVNPSPEMAHIKMKLGFFGDSLVHGDEVKDQDCWISRLQTKLPEMQLFNGGVPGYGTDQAFMRFEASSLPFDWVFLGLALCDETRNINILRLHRSRNTALPFMKPRFIHQEKGLRKVTPPFAELTSLKENYLKEETQQFLQKYDFYYPASPKRIWLQSLINRSFKKLHLPLWLGKNPFKISRQLTLKIVQHFHHLAEEQNRKSTILLIPTENELLQQPNGLDIYCKELEACKIPYFDLRKAFEGKNLSEYPREDLWCPQGHFSTVTSEWIASYLSQEIQKKLENSHGRIP